MAAPKPAVLLLLLAVFALLAFFVLGVGLGAGDKPPPSREEKLAWRDKLFGAPSPVLPAELELKPPCAGTPALSRVPAGESCQIQVGSAKARLRKLTATSRDVVRLVYTSNGRVHTPIQVRLEGGSQRKAELTVQNAGGVLELSCEHPTSPLGCLVSLQ